MGNSIGYNKVALVQWYREGKAIYGVEGFKKAAATFTTPTFPKGSMAGKVVAVTGGNQGIGFEAALGCALLGAEVHLLCRSAERAEGAAADIRRRTQEELGAQAAVQIHQLDVSEMAQVRRVAKDLSESFTKDGKTLDVLVNNAGCMPDKLTKTSEGHEAITACTLGGTLLLTSLLLPSMTRGSQVINVASGGAYSVDPRVEDLDFTNVPADKYDGTLYYAYAKRSQILLTELMSEKIYPKLGIRFNAMHPGWADTEALRSSMKDFYEANKETLRSPAQGADTIVYLACSADQELKGKSGLYWFDRSPVRVDMPWSGTRASAEQKNKLWNSAIKYVGGDMPALSALVDCNCF